MVLLKAFLGLGRVKSLYLQTNTKQGCIWGSSKNVSHCFIVKASKREIKEGIFQVSISIPFVKRFYESGSLISQRKVEEKQKLQEAFLDQGSQVKGVCFNWSKKLFWEVCLLRAIYVHLFDPPEIFSHLYVPAFCFISQ